MTAATRPRTGHTSRADTAWSVAVAVAAVALVLAGVVLLLLARHDVGNARAKLTTTLFAEARAEHRSPRDPRVLAVVSRQLPADVSLVPSPAVLSTGRVDVVSQRIRNGSGRLCLLLPPSTSGRIVPCPRASSAPRAAVRRSLLPARS